MYICLNITIDVNIYRFELNVQFYEVMESVVCDHLLTNQIFSCTAINNIEICVYRDV